MAFQIDRFTASIGRMDGLQSPSKFHVRAYLPSSLDSTVLEFSCEAANVPGITIASSAVKPHGYGSQYEVPLVPIYEDVQLSCMIDNSGRVTELFSKWQKSVVNHDYAPGEMGSSARPFNVSYRDSYAGIVEITAFDQAGFENRTITLHQAWPKVVGSVQKSWREKDSYSVLPVTLTYRSHTTTDIRS